MLIKQRNNTDCAICSLAMLTASTYEQVARKLRPNAGVSQEESTLYLVEEGFVPLFLVTDEYMRDVAEDWQQRKAWAQTKLAKYLMGRRALLTVRSGSLLHCVYFDGFKVLDPARGVKKLSDYVLCDALVVDRERLQAFDRDDLSTREARKLFTQGVHSV
ncbi:hypothetical protein P5E67_00695 [Vibrio parahaemolyticus]|nr:hypothetical protein [Vibrio parahaemolyticus]